MSAGHFVSIIKNKSNNMIVIVLDTPSSVSASIQEF